MARHVRQRSDSSLYGSLDIHLRRTNSKDAQRSNSHLVDKNVP